MAICHHGTPMPLWMIHFVNITLPTLFPHTVNRAIKTGVVQINEFFVLFFVREFSSSFNGDLWGHNGPKVLTRVLRRICNTKSTGKMTAKKCRGFHVLSRKAFYAIPSKDWEMFFNPNDTEETLKMTANSVMAHLWNKLSSSQRINQKSAYGIIASRNCPKIFQILSTQIE